MDNHYENHFGKLKEMWENNSGGLTPGMVINYMYEQGMIIDRSDSEGQLDAVVKPATCEKADLAYFYNAGYMAGHHDTVEAQYTDLHPSDMDNYHDEIIDEIIEERKLSV